jgi:hypothetical protein
MSRPSNSAVLLLTLGALAVGAASVHFFWLAVPGLSAWTAAGVLGIGVALLGGGRNALRAARVVAVADRDVHAFARGDDELHAQIQLQADADALLLQQLARRGVDVAAAQPVILHFTAARADLAQELAARLQRDLGGEPRVHGAEAGGVTAVDLRLQAAPAALAAPEQVAERVRTAARFFAEHDGWSLGG